MKNPAMILVFILTLLVKCGPSTPAGQRLSADSFETSLQKTSGAILLDVRTAGEYEAGHLKDAVLIDVQRADFQEKVRLLDKSRAVFVYCASGIRSERAAVMLNQLGFKQVYELRGGFNEWSEAGKPFVQ